MKFDTFSTDFLSMAALSITSQAPPAQWGQIHCEFAIENLDIFFPFDICM
jgi:hypothetical protein